MNRFVNVVLAIVLGAITGGFLSLKLWSSHPFMGVLVGGLIGYLSYDFPQVLRAIRVTGIYVVNSSIDRSVQLVLSIYLRAILWAVSISVPSSLFLAWLHSLEPPPINGHTLSFLTFATGMFMLAFLPSTMIGITFIEARVTGGFPRKSMGLANLEAYNKQLSSTYFLRALSIPPVFWFWWLPTRAFMSPFLLIGQIVRHHEVIGAILWNLLVAIYVAFQLIHSAVRVLCFAYAALGSIVAYMSGNLWLGAAIAGISGGMAYQLIFRMWLEEGKQVRMPFVELI